MLKQACIFLALMFALAVAAPVAVAGERKLPLDDHGYASMGPLAADPTVGKDQVPVAAFFGTEQSRGYVSIDLPLLVGEVRRLELRMKEDADPDAGQVAPESATIVSCPLLAPFDSGQQQGKPPKEDCAAPIAGARGKRGVWTFDLTRYARSWAEGEPNHGVSLRFGSRARSETWRVVFDAEASGAILVAEPKEGGGGLAGPDPLTQPPPPQGGSQDGSVFGPPPSTADPPSLPAVGGPLSEGGIAQTDPVPQPSPVQAASPVPATASAPISSASSDQEEQLRLPLVTLVLVPAVAGLVGFALRSPRLAHLLDPNAALGPAKPVGTPRQGSFS